MKNKVLNFMVFTIVSMVLVMTPSVGEEQSKQLNTEKLEELIKISSLEIQTANAEVEQLEYKRRQAESKKNTGATILETNLNVSYNTEIAKKTLDYAMTERDETIDAVVLEGKYQFYKYLITTEQEARANVKLTRLKSELAQIKSKVELGLAVKSDIDKKNIEIQKAELDVLKYTMEKEEIVLSLNQYLLWDLSTATEILAEDIPVVKWKEFDIPALIEAELESDKDLVKLKTELKLAKDYYNIHIASGTLATSDTAKDAKDAIADLEFSLTDKRLQVEMGVYTSYNVMLNAKDNVTLKELDIVNATNEYDRLLKRFEVGFETQVTVGKASETLESAKVNLQLAELDFYKAFESFVNDYE